MNKKYYEVLSLNLVAYLKMKGFSVVKAEKTPKGVQFYFEKSQELFDAVTEYNQDEYLKKFISEFKAVKDIVNALR